MPPKNDEQDELKAQPAGKGDPARAPNEGREKFTDEATNDVVERWTDKDGQRWEKITYGANPNPEKQRQRPGTHTTTKVEELMYFWGRFQAAGQASDQQIIKVWYKGHGKQYKRSELVIVPSTHLGVCGIANQERFKMVPGEPLKRLAPYNSYGFTIDFTLGKRGVATQAEYDQRIAEGNEQNKAAVSRGNTVQQQQ